MSDFEEWLELSGNSKKLRLYSMVMSLFPMIGLKYDDMCEYMNTQEEELNKTYDKYIQQKEIGDIKDEYNY